MTRRRKPPRVPQSQSSGDDGNDPPTAGDGEQEGLRPVKKRNKAIRPQVAERAAAVTKTNERLPTQEESEAQVPFCCAICHCSKERKAQVLMYKEEAQQQEQQQQQVPANDNHNWIQPAEGDELLWHRRCCHGQFNVVPDESWAIPYVAAEQH